MNKKILPALLLALLGAYAVMAQKEASVSSTAFKQLVGCWQGTLNYSGTIIRKPYTTTTQLVVKQLNSSQFELVHIYTTDPNDKKKDTLTIAADGRRLNNDSVISSQCAGDSLEIITQSSGFDHDNNKAAIIRHTYTISKQQYVYKKEVQLEGQTEWLPRQEFTYTRVACGNKN